MLMKENDAVFKADRRYPKEGWQYLKYLARTEQTHSSTLESFP
jgi:hypothetical protein